jgi:hypothetical protein
MGSQVGIAISAMGSQGSTGIVKWVYTISAIGGQASNLGSQVGVHQMCNG